MKDLIGTWLIEDTYIEPATKFIVTQTDRIFGKLGDAIDNYIRHKNTQQFRITFYSADDVTSP